MVLGFDSLINRVSTPYPLLYPTTFDLMPLMSFQQALDGNLNVCRLFGSVSISLGASKDGWTNREHDIKYAMSRVNPRATEVEYDSHDPENTMTQRTLWNQVQDDLGATFPELNINCRVPVLKTPPKLDLDTDILLFLQTKTGNFTRSLRQRFGLVGIRNPYLIMRNRLRERHLWKKEYGRKLRGVLKTTNVVAYDNQKIRGWDTFIKPPATGHRFPQIANQLTERVTQDRWWQDYGVPIKLLGTMNSNEVEAIVYQLMRNKAIITA